MSPESLCVSNKEIILWVQPVDQVFVSWSDQLIVQIEASKDSVVFGKLPSNLKIALDSSEYGVAAQAYLQIGQAAKSNGVQWLDEGRLNYLANQSMAAQLGFNPAKTVATENGIVRYLDPKFPKALQAIQQDAGLIATGDLNKETLQVVTGVSGSELVDVIINPQQY